MKGTLLTIQAGGKKTVREIEGPLDLATLQKAIGGGTIETVPGFTTIMRDGKRHRCVAFCDEDGKQKELSLNGRATVMWHLALPPPGLLLHGAVVADRLVGDIAVVWGDEEWMEAL